MVIRKFSVGHGCRLREVWCKRCEVLSGFDHTQVDAMTEVKRWVERM